MTLILRGAFFSEVGILGIDMWLWIPVLIIGILLSVALLIVPKTKWKPEPRVVSFKFHFKSTLNLTILIAISLGHCGHFYQLLRSCHQCSLGLSLLYLDHDQCYWYFHGNDHPCNLKYLCRYVREWISGLPRFRNYGDYWTIRRANVQLRYWFQHRLPQEVLRQGEIQAFQSLLDREFASGKRQAGFYDPGGA